MSVASIHTRTLFFVFMLLCIIQNADAVYFRHIGVRDGLSQTSVMSIYQDELGRMWFGTEEGLSLYNGKEIFSYKHSEDSIISRHVPVGNMTFPITGDKNGNVYFVSDNRLIHYDTQKERFFCLKERGVSTVYCKDSLVLIAISDTIFSWNHTNRTFKQELITNLRGQTIQKIFIDSKGRLWVGTRRGLLLFDNHESSHIIKDEDIYDMFEDSKSNLWIATRYTGMYKISPNGDLSKFVHQPNRPNSIPHNHIRCFAEDNYGNIWIGTFNGLCKYNPATDLYTTYKKDDLPGSLTHSSVFSLYKDHQGTIWVGTYYGGVHYFNPETDHFSYYTADVRRNDCLSHFFVGQMVEDKEQNLWICTEGGGLNYFDRKTKTFRHFLADENKHTLPHNNLKNISYSKKHDKLCIRSHTAGISIYDIKKNVFHNFRDEKPDYHEKLGDVYQTALYNDDSLIIRCRSGFHIYDLTTEKLSLLFDGVPQPSGTVFFIDSQDYLWTANASTITKVNIKNQTDLTRFNRKETGFGTFEVSCIMEDHKGRLFFGTMGSGLYQYDRQTNRFIGYTAERNELLSNYCYEIVQSEQNELIISGDKGLSFLNPENKRLKEIRLDALLFSGINHGCGLFVSSNGEVFVGGIGGMISFFEQELFSINKDYDLHFSSLSINEEQIYSNDNTRILDRAFPYTRKITLNHKQNNFKISFTSNNYIHAYTGNQFEYQLEGFDNKWISGTEIIYTNIRPGKYKLTVREKNNDNIPTPKSISMEIVIRHAWYANPVAYTIYFLILSAILYYFLRFTKVRQRLRNSLEMERKEKEQIEQLNQSKLQFFANISHEFHTPLTLIIVQIERLLNSSNISPYIYNKLLKIDKQTILLRNLISELLDFRKLEQGHLKLKVRELNIVPFLKEIYFSFYELSSTQNIAYTFNAPENEEILCLFDPKQLQKVFSNLISNAFKYTRPTDSIEISVMEENDSVIVKVIDSGIGIGKEEIHKIFDRFYQADNTGHHSSKSPSTGIGLSVVKGIVELHHGHISVESKPSYGSIFIVSLQKGSKHFSPVEIVEETEASAFLKHEKEPDIRPPDQLPALDATEHSDEIEYEDKTSTVLIVEDNDELLQVLQDILSPAYRILTAHNGKEGLDIAREEKPDLVVSDIMMPEMSGTEMCVAIKNDIETCHIPVILLTALSSVEHSIYGLQHGADDYISKPFNERALLTRCNSLIRNRLILKNKFSRNLDFDVQSISNNPIDQKFLDTINRIIETNFDNPDFNINTLADGLNVSRSSLYSKFESLTGMTPNDYVLQRKLKSASHLLKNNPELNISEISDRFSFGSPRYFSRCFKKQFGLTPAEYRKKDNR